MLYCTRCRTLFQENSCPECGSLGRTPENGDFCLLAQQPGIFAKMLLEVLEQNGIEAASQATQGATGIFSNMNMEIYRIYVPLERLEQAQELRDELFSPEAAVGEETDDDEASGETEEP